jgi:hypothetical protein
MVALPAALLFAALPARIGAAQPAPAGPGSPTTAESGGDRLGADDAAAAPARRGPTSSLFFPFAVSLNAVTGAELQDRDGSVDDELYQFSGGVIFGSPIPWKNRFSISLDGSYANYDFDGTGGTPFSDRDFYTVGLTLSGSVELSPEFSLMLSPSLSFGVEDGANFVLGARVGTMGGLWWSVSPEFRILLGAMVNWQPEIGDWTFRPLAGFAWQIDDDWSIGARGPGIEVSYSPGRPWEFGIGVEFRTALFRLAETSPGQQLSYFEDLAIPLTFRAVWAPNPGVALEVRAGATIYRELIGRDGNGDDLTGSREKLDPAPFAAVIARITFPG